MKRLKPFKDVPKLLGADSVLFYMPSNAPSSTNNFRCNACGRYFDTAGQLASHEIECRAAKQATETGRAELEREDARPHQKNDKDVDAHPFPHGTKTT